MGVYYIISDSQKAVSKTNIENLKVAVFVHLFYEEQIDIYQHYLEGIPDFIDIVIISSKEIILESFNGKRVKKIKKENRGRDISALLIAAKELIFGYEYICFIHDKKEKRAAQKDYVDSWIKNLWDNMLQTSIYVYNILDAFQNDRIGMMVPLPPYDKEDGAWLNGAWGADFENVKMLADSLSIAGNIRYEKPPITYSTVFWARSVVLKKLFAKDWNYSDFPEEPMKEDGEINHAIERILQYVVEDAGYETKIVLSASFAGGFLERLNCDIRGLWDQLDTTVGISNYRGLDNYNRIRAFAKEYFEIYLYGAGKKGKECLKLCRALDITPKGFIVTENSHLHYVEDVPVFPISKISFKDTMGVIIATNSSHWGDIKNELGKRNFRKYIVYE